MDLDELPLLDTKFAAETFEQLAQMTTGLATSVRSENASTHSGCQSQQAIIEYS